MVFNILFFDEEKVFRDWSMNEIKLPEIHNDFKGIGSYTYLRDLIAIMEWDVDLGL